MLSEQEIKFLSSVQNLDFYDIAYADFREIVLISNTGARIKITIDDGLLKYEIS